MRKNTDAPLSGGAAGGSEEGSVMGLERSSGVVPTGRVSQPGNGEELARPVKPFGITKRVVWDAYQHVKANQGAEGIDRQTIEMFEANLKDNLYRIWNRMCSGSYFPPAVRLVEIPKKNGGVRTLGIPTVADRIAQTVVKKVIEPGLEKLFHPDSYGYRPNKSALQAVEVTRERCWDYAWAVEFDIQKAFDELDHDLLLRAVRKHVKERWAVLYIERWLTAPFVKPDGTTVERHRGVPQGSVVGPVLMNLFMHFAFDRWMQTEQYNCPFERYADDAVVHCQSNSQAVFMLHAIGIRFGQCGLKLHPDKSKVVYCRRTGRRHRRNVIRQFTFLGFTFRPRVAKSRNGRLFHAFLPAVSREAVTKMLQTIRSWKLTRQTQASITELAARYNPILRGWWNYYGQQGKTVLRKFVFDQFDAALARWVRRKYKGFKRHIGRSFTWIWRVAQKLPRLFTHWRVYGYAGGRAMGAV
jgi:RNA-directed DNA polymerase